LRGYKGEKIKNILIFLKILGLRFYTCRIKFVIQKDFNSKTIYTMKNFAKFTLVALTISMLGLTACAKKPETATTPETTTTTPETTTAPVAADTTKAATAPVEAPKQ
jgi:hypothetical protein